MTFKEQINKIKDNWLIIALIVLALFASGAMQSLNASTSFQVADAGFLKGISYNSEIAGSAARMSSSYYSPSSDFAPDVTDRKITKTSSLSTEVENGKFAESEAKLKSIVTNADAFLLNENSNKYGKDKKTYYVGSYQVKVDVAKYDATIALLKEIGDVTYFNENSNDITGQYVNNEKQLEIEKEKLARYKAKLNETKDVSEWIDLSDRIASEEYMVKYYQDLLTKQDLQVQYSTVYVTITEKQATFSNIVFVTFENLIKNLVDSFNTVVSLIFTLIPWAIVFWIGLLVYRKMNKSNKKDEAKVKAK